MKPSALRPGDRVIYNDGWLKPRTIEFVERVPGCGRNRPAVNIFKVRGAELVTMPDYEVVTRVESAAIRKGA